MRGSSLRAGLDRALGPAVLLRLEGVHLDRHFGGRDEVRHEQELPALELRAVAEVEVLGERIVLPAARVGDHLAAPDAGGAVEVEERAGAVAAAVLEDEVPVEHDRLDARQQRVVAVDVAPARLHHADLRFGELRQRPLQEVGRRHEVGVEDGDELAARDLEAGFERAGLVAGAVDAMEILDVEALRGVAADRQLGNRARLVGGVVEDLDFEEVLRIIHLDDRRDEAVDHVHLVVDGQLDRDDRKRIQLRPRLRHVVLVLHVDPHKVVAMPPVHREDAQDEEVGREDRGIS